MQNPSRSSEEPLLERCHKLLTTVNSLNVLVPLGFKLGKSLTLIPTVNRQNNIEKILLGKIESLTFVLLRCLHLMVTLWKEYYVRTVHGESL